MSRKRHAYISFQNPENKEAIENKQVNIKGYIAQWISDDIKTCFICEEAGHFAVECQWKKEKHIQQKTNIKLATRYNSLGIDSKNVSRPIANIMKRQQTSQSYATAVKGNIEANKLKQGKYLADKASAPKFTNDVNKNIEDRLNHLETHFDKLEVVLNKIVDHLEKGKNPVTSLPSTPIAKQAEIPSNEELPFQSLLSWNNLNSNPVGMLISKKISSTNHQ